MDAGLPFDSGHQQPVSLDGGTGITLSSDGQVQIDDNDGSLSHPENPDIHPLDSNQLSTLVNNPFTTAFVTQTSPGLLTSAPAISRNTIQSYTTSEVEFTSLQTSVATSVETTPLHAASSGSIQPLSIASVVPTTTSFDFAQSSSPSSYTEWTSSIYTFDTWTSWATSQPFSVSSSLPSSSAGTPSCWSVSRSTSSSVSITSTISSLRPATTSNFSSSFSTPQSTTQSIASSSTTTEQLPSQTIVAPPLPANLNVHSPTFYAGIALGTIITIGLIAALIAWWIRLRSRRRRSDRLMVPWGRSEDTDDGSLEAGYSASSMDTAALGARNLGSREDLAHVQAWSPRGDRDVGEPKRAESYFSGPFYGLSDSHIISRHGHHLDISNSSYPAGGLANAPIRHLPSHLVADGIFARSQRGGSFCDERYIHPAQPQGTFLLENDRAYGAPRGPGVHGHGLEMPWDENANHPHAPRTMAERLRNLGKPTAEPGAEPGPLPSPDGPRLGNEELEEWGHSFKASLVNAFNAVAANLGAGAPRMKEDDSDKLTAPPRRSIRKSLKNTVREGGKQDEKKHSRSGSISTTISKPWTLEETANGAGIVHLHLSEFENHDHDTQRPHMPAQTLSFGDGENFHNLDKVHQSVQPAENRVLLIASSKPPQALIRPDTYFSRQKSTDLVNGNTQSRRSSIYSMMSARSGALAHRGSKLSRIRSATGNTRWKTQEDDTVVIQPDAISRLSSSDSSFSPAGGARSSVDAFASRALQTRQKRLAESQNR